MADVSEVIAADVPEFRQYLQTLKEQADTVTQQIQALSTRVSNGELTTSNGVSLLDVKYHSLLSYVLDIISIVLCKVNGFSIADTDAVSRTVEFRTVLEKIRPLEQKLKYQIDKVIQSANTSSGLTDNDPLKLKPNLGNFQASDDDEDEDLAAQENKKYVPPHIAGVKLEEVDRMKLKAEKMREQTLAKSSIISELLEEVSDMPVEVTQLSHFRARAIKENEERRVFEEENFMRVSASKKKRSKDQEFLRKSELETLANFGNLDALHGNMAGNNKRKLSSKGSKKGGKSKKGKFRK